MYFYLFDSFLSKGKFNKTLAKIETRIVDLGIDGKRTRLTVLKSMKDLVKGAIEKGAKTIVVAGNDKTINQVINVVADEDVTLGFIPIGPRNKLAQLLGIPLGETACDVLSSRLIEKIDLGKINSHYFLSSVSANGDNIILEGDQRYKIVPPPHSQVHVCNFGCRTEKPSNPKDGVLETVISLQKNKVPIFNASRKENSIFYNKQVRITSSLKDKGPVPLLADGIKVLNTPAIMKVVPKKLRIIVGKKRMF